MARRRKRGLNGELIDPLPRLDADWHRETEWRGPTGRILTPGVEFKVKGERGRFRFIEFVRTPKGAEWVTCAGGTKKVVTTRSFRPDRVIRVYRDRKILSGRDAIILMRAKAAAKGAGA